MKRNRTKRILSMLLTLCMVLTLVPITAFAAETYTLTIVDGTKSEGGETVVVCGRLISQNSWHMPQDRIHDQCRWQIAAAHHKISN